MAEYKRLKLEDIDVDWDLQPRANGLDQSHVDELADAYRADRTVEPVVEDPEQTLPATVVSHDRAGRLEVEVTDTDRVLALDISGAPGGGGASARPKGSTSTASSASFSSPVKGRACW